MSTVLAVLALAGFAYWGFSPIHDAPQPIEFTIKPASGVRSLASQISDAGVPVNPWLFGLLARVSGKAAHLKAGSFEVEPGISPYRLLEKIANGEFSQGTLAIIEGWAFLQMRKAIDSHPALRHDTAGLSDADLLKKLGADFRAPEGLFFPDTYLFAKGSSDLQVYQQAHIAMLKHLDELWNSRAQGLPYKTPYEALIMASIVEKETGRKSERGMVAAVFINRLKNGMMLQTDPTVIYGMGDQYKGKIYKHDLQTDTPYNTYTRAGLPPTPIALPGIASITAALNPAGSSALYFVARGDGSSQFSDNLTDHNRAVTKYQR